MPFFNFSTSIQSTYKQLQLVLSLYWCAYALLVLKVMVKSQSRYNEYLEQVHSLKNNRLANTRVSKIPIKPLRVGNETTNQASRFFCSLSENGMIVSEFGLLPVFYCNKPGKV